MSFLIKQDAKRKKTKNNLNYCFKQHIDIWEVTDQLKGTQKRTHENASLGGDTLKVHIFLSFNSFSLKIMKLIQYIRFLFIYFIKFSMECSKLAWIFSFGHLYHMYLI